MQSIHVTRWTQQLEHAGHEIFWFNIRGGVPNVQLPWVTQYTDWHQKLPNIKGRYLLKKLGKKIKPLGAILENDVASAFAKVIQEIQPDIVHSFALYVACTPILDIMKKNDIPWVYSSWGSDLFYFKEDPKHLADIKKVLARVNYMFSDCQRDYNIAKELGYTGEHLGVFPGGGGFPIAQMEDKIRPIVGRKTILVKGYQGRSGRAIAILEALSKCSEILTEYTIEIFAADPEVIDAVDRLGLGSKLALKVTPKTQFIQHNTILEMMGSALIYIGNSNSDGMPNTLLEAMIMGAFPIQSNPGGATAEVIDTKSNGLLIQDCTAVDEIVGHIKEAVHNESLREAAFEKNQSLKAQWDSVTIQNQVIAKYNHIKQDWDA